MFSLLSLGLSASSKNQKVEDRFGWNVQEKLPSNNVLDFGDALDHRLALRLRLQKYPLSRLIRINDDINLILNARGRISWSDILKLSIQNWKCESR